MIVEPMSRRIQAAIAEWLGTALLLSVVTGSGIMADRLSEGNQAVALLCNTLATGLALFVLILTLGSLSGAHFNPVVTMTLAVRGKFDRSQLPSYIFFQCAGAICGVWLAHAMFDLPILQWSLKSRSGIGQWISEAVASAGLIFVVLRIPSDKAASGVAAYIGSAYWFTASTAFANPAATLGRMFTNTFAGIAPDCVIPYICAQFVGSVAGIAICRALETSSPEPKTQQ